MFGSLSCKPVHEWGWGGKLSLQVRGGAGIRACSLCLATIASFKVKFSIFQTSGKSQQIQESRNWTVHHLLLGNTFLFKLKKFKLHGKFSFCVYNTHETVHKTWHTVTYNYQVNIHVDTRQVKKQNFAGTRSPHAFPDHSSWGNTIPRWPCLLFSLSFLLCAPQHMSSFMLLSLA